MKKFLLASVLSLSFLFPLEAEAIENGKSALGENVVTFLLKDKNTDKYSLPTCSGSLIAPQIVVTAKHCVKGHNSQISWLIDENWEVSFPGADIQSPELRTAKILSIFSYPGEFTENDDFAVLVIDTPFPVYGNLKIATKDDLTRFRAAQSPTLTYGYGSSSTSNLQSLVPFKIENKIIQDFPGRSWGPQVFAIQYLKSDSHICGGDSGGPNYVVDQGAMYFIGPTSFTTRFGCAKGLVGDFHLGGTALAYKTELLEKAEEFLAKAKSEAEAAAKAVAELKARQESEAKTKAEAAKKKTTLICVKGKTVKKVIAKNPKCPKGYKVKI